MDKDSLREMLKQHKLQAKQNIDEINKAANDHKYELIKPLQEKSIKHGKLLKAIVLRAVKELGYDGYDKLDDELNKETGLD